jgi:hypothetical protein
LVPYRGLPSTVQTASFWIDDSGPRGSAQKGFVLAGLKTRRPDDLQRTVHAVRETHDHYPGELKFNSITDRNFPRYRDIVDVLEDSDALVVGTVVDTSWNPFAGTQDEPWAAQAALIGRMIERCLNVNEVGSVFMDLMSTPKDVSMGHHVKRHANSLLKAKRVTTAVSLDSKTNDLLQLADLIAGAIYYQRCQHGDPSTTKGKIAARLATTFAAGTFERDVRAERVNIAVARPHLAEAVEPRRRGRHT